MKGSEGDKGDRDNSGNNRDNRDNSKDSIKQMVTMRLSFLTTCLTNGPSNACESARKLQQVKDSLNFNLILSIPFPSQQFRYNRVNIKSGRSDSITPSAHPPTELH
ncbi:hypothetical protein GQ607_015958 [Colletotrichum asianum]|uniref:Uncharacterized protein n=1 Tax=Colletotrichum asianum TaxID=702518 RepID=A0A8H3VYT1_9PEZI|nr:hypothetical protein GQ607_015958 [Colletotrichum asianum]